MVKLEDFLKRLKKRRIKNRKIKEWLVRTKCPKDEDYFTKGEFKNITK